MSAPPVTREGAFQEMLGLAMHSYLTYVVESSSPVVVDDADRRMLALFHELLEKETYYVERAYELLEKTRLRPRPPTFTIKSSNFNFLRPMKLAEHAAEQIATEIGRLEALKGRVLEDDACGLDLDRLLDDFLALRREEVRRISELRAASAPPAASATPAAGA